VLNQVPRHEGVLGNGDIAPRTQTRRYNGQLQTPAALPLGKDPRYALVRKMGGLQSWSGHGTEDEKSPFLVKNRTSVRSLVTMLNEVPWAPISYIFIIK
jgi:hypothetical protein